MYLALISIFCYLFLISFSKAKRRMSAWILFSERGDFGDDDELEAPPTFGSQIPGWAQGLPMETLGLIRQSIGQQIPVPQEYGVASDYLQQALQYQPDQFQFPMESIQKALEAQQRLQYQDYLEQVKPIAARQGQLDSTGYTNMIGDFIRGQQAQTYGTTADLLTQQALNNMQIQQWLPQYQAGVAGQLGGLGQQRAGIAEANIRLPYETYIPGLENLYQTGLYQAGQEYESAIERYNVELENQERKRQSNQGWISTLGTLGGVALGALSGGMLAPAVMGAGGVLTNAIGPAMMAGGALGGALGGTASTLFGGSGSGINMSDALALSNSVYNPQQYNQQYNYRYDPNRRRSFSPYDTNSGFIY